MPNISDDPRLLLSLASLLCAVTFMCLYLQEERRAPEQRTTLRGLGTFLLYIYPIAFVIAAYLGIAVMFDSGDPQNLVPVFSNGLVVAALLLWGWAKKVRH